MSASAAVDTLAKSPADRDPTRTKTLRRRYAQRLRGQFANLNTAIREAVRERDIFRLGQDTDTLQPADPRPPDARDFIRAQDDEKIDAFMDWLQSQEERGVLEVIDRDENQYIRSAYGTGLRNANRRLRDEGFEVDEAVMEATFNQPVHRDAVQRLFTRNFRELEGVTDAMDRQISRELAEGFTRGDNPNEMAARITDRVDKIGKTRSTTLARTETVRTHSEATLNRYEEFGVQNVTVRAEWLTAGDNRVCPICQSLEGRVFTVEEARTETRRVDLSGAANFSVDSMDVPIKPPAHPRCRCSLTPVIS